MKELVRLLEQPFDKERYQIVATGVTGSARKLVGTILGATMVKNEITAHAVGTTTFYPDVRTILEIGGQDSKIILVENGVAVDYAMNTLRCGHRGLPLQPGQASGHRGGGNRRLRPPLHPSHPDCRPVYRLR